MRPSIPWGTPAGMLLLTLAFAAHAFGQITPDQLYYGIDRAIPMTVERPDGEDGELSIRLLDARDASVIESQNVPEGAVDLAGLFPLLWTASTPELMHAQLFAGETKVGPSVVLQPVIAPEYAYLVDARTAEPVLPRPGDRTQIVQFQRELAALRESKQKPYTPPYQPVYSGIRAYVNKHVVFETTEGRIVFRLRPEEAPNTCWNFRHLAEGGWYTDIPFHRVLPGFVIQAGDPTGLGSGGPGYMIDLEPTTLRHDFGVLSMARSGNPNSNGSQIFVCLSRERTAALDGRYTAFGEAVEGADAIVAIASTPLADPQAGRPVEAPRIVRAYLEDASPHGEGAGRVTRPAASSPPR